MSRSNPTADPIQNPCERWFQWDSTTKQFKYYDKELPNPKDASKKGANVFVPIPFKFLVLDVLTTVAGFSDDESSSFYANEVRNHYKTTSEEVLDVKLKKQTVLKGTWEQIKDKAEAMGAKYAHSIYIGYFDEKKNLKLGNIKLYGASIGAWFEKTQEIRKTGKKIEECAFAVKTTKAGKKGSVTWNEPVFELIKTSPETEAAAVELDKVLQDYLKEYFSKKTESKSEVVSQPETKAEAIKANDDFLSEMNAPVASSDFEDEPF